MEWIRISTHKLKIMLSAEDAHRYALDCERADYAELIPKDAFREILNDVQSASGFEAGDDKIYIQMYPSKAGGCELFVTRMGLSFEGEEPPIAPLGIPPKKQKSPVTVQKRAVALAFECMEELLRLCRCLAPRFHGESEVWRGEDARWWLLLWAEGEARDLRREIRFLREFGELRDAEAARTLLAEHGSPVCVENAVQTLAEF